MIDETHSDWARTDYSKLWDDGSERSNPDLWKANYSNLGVRTKLANTSLRHILGGKKRMASNKKQVISPW